ncbi:hypothetical protein P692DRAFT_201808537 [Suillus brevipes Sb2]|nr:hypothetical protein P692DRAFT_201808537 [Suillus brevipes Sb2]
MQDHLNLVPEVYMNRGSRSVNGAQDRGSNSDTNEEPPKQLPLNEKEVVVLEAYLEQWNSTSGKERNVVWGDVYHKWLQSHGETKNSKPPITIGRRWTYWSVIESLRKKGLLKKIEDETRVKAGEHGMMNHYSKYLTEMVESLTEKEIEEATEMAVQWNKQAVPLEVQDDIARRKSDNILLYVAKEMFKRAGMRLFMLSA